MIKVGDGVTTGFYAKDKNLIRTVVKVERYQGASESGWVVTTKDGLGRHLSCDMNWYNKVENVK